MTKLEIEKYVQYHLLHIRYVGSLLSKIEENKLKKFAARILVFDYLMT